MVTKKKVSDKAKEASTTVTRIKAEDTKQKNTVKKVVTSETAEVSAKSSPLGRLATPFGAIGGYFKGAWYELKQVRWPNRRATWSLTAAVIGFTAVFTIIILLLDALFKYLFQLILG